MTNNEKDKEKRVTAWELMRENLTAFDAVALFLDGLTRKDLDERHLPSDFRARHRSKAETLLESWRKKGLWPPTATELGEPPNLPKEWLDWVDFMHKAQDLVEQVSSEKTPGVESARRLHALCAKYLENFPEDTSGKERT